MKKPPVAVLLVSILFIVAGLTGFIYHFGEVLNSSGDLLEVLWVELVRIIAVVCGVFLLLSRNWARWLAIVWLAYHVVIGAYHSTSQMIVHAVLLLVITVLLYLPTSSAFFKRV